AIVALLLEHGADPGRVDVSGFTPLMTAAFGGNPRVIDLLVNAGADPNQSTRALQTPLGIAAMWGHDRTVEVLLARGADPRGVAHGASRPHDPPLVAAARSAMASPALLRQLIDAGADVNGTDD